MNSKQRRRLVREFKPEMASLRAVARLTGKFPDFPYTAKSTDTEHLNAAELRYRHTARFKARFLNAEACRDSDYQAVRPSEEVAQVR